MLAQKRFNEARKVIFNPSIFEPIVITPVTSRILMRRITFEFQTDPLVQWFKASLSAREVWGLIPSTVSDFTDPEIEPRPPGPRMMS